ncbi:MAG: FAD-dependent oxidoreductase [Parcubacteria group bacterium]|nr:FAD-dependent oxidoreductase [Parcubacteria group bacterium]
MNKNIFETIIIGAGMSGLTAAMYASRKRMNYKIISTDIGGQFLVSGEVLNYPGIIQTSGIELKTVMEKQMEANQVKISTETVVEVKKDGQNFEVVTDKEKYRTKSIIISTGSKARMLNVPGEERLSKRGVTYCSICDGPLFSDMIVAVVGGGDSAMEAVDFLKDICKKIYMIVRGDSLTGHEYLQERTRDNSKVEILYNTDTKEILGDKLVSGIKVEQDGKEKELEVRGVIIEIGRIPHTEPFKDLVELDSDGHIEIDCQMQTNVPGIFAAGDVASGHEYQYVISAGQGCMALLKVARYLAGRSE